MGDFERISKPKRISKPTILLRAPANSNKSVSVTAPEILPNKTQGKDGGTSASDSVVCRFTDVPKMSKCVTIIDETMSWIEGAGMDQLLDQTDFLVIGSVGTQASGVSTILSSLAGFDIINGVKSCPFKLETSDSKGKSWHETNGIQLFVTHERLILLDSQPVISQAVLDQTIDRERSLPPNYSFYENWTEVHAIQQIAFLLTVCNIVLLVVDDFIDLNFMRLVRAAEMLRPSVVTNEATPSAPSTDSVASETPTSEHSPHVVVVLNKADTARFDLDMFEKMQRTLASLFVDTTLRCRSTPPVVSMCDEGLGLNFSLLKPEERDLNFFMIPRMPKQSEKSKNGYQPHTGFSELLINLRNQLLSAFRTPVTQSLLSERSWLHYASKQWSAIRQSTLISEFNRTLP